MAILELSRLSGSVVSAREKKEGQRQDSGNDVIIYESDLSAFGETDPYIDDSQRRWERNQFFGI